MRGTNKSEPISAIKIIISPKPENISSASVDRDNPHKTGAEHPILIVFLQRRVWTLRAESLRPFYYEYVGFACRPIGNIFPFFAESGKNVQICCKSLFGNGLRDGRVRISWGG